MFEHYENDHRPKRSVWVRIAVSASVVAHVGVAAALIISAGLETQQAQPRGPPGRHLFVRFARRGTAVSSKQANSDQEDRSGYHQRDRSGR